MHKFLMAFMVFVALFSADKTLAQDHPLQMTFIGSIEPKPVSAQIVKAWEQAGSEFSIIDVDGFDFLPLEFKPTARFKLPCFSLMSTDNISKLPSPDTPFAVSLRARTYGESVRSLDLNQLVNFKNLEVLIIRLSNGRDLLDIGKLKQLKWLSLQNLLEVADDTLTNISSLTQLKALDITARYTATDAGIKTISSLRELQSLRLDVAGITDDHVKYLAELHDLKWLRLSNTQLSDASLQHVSRLKNLRFLTLYLNNITGERLDLLSELDQLRYLNVSRSLTDEGIKNLSNFTTSNIWF